ncbi:MAG: type I restriction enzyme HsdR N-terminal domain-containing protein [Prolixibacteraceae bacterium]
MLPELNLPSYSFRTRQKAGKIYIFDEIRKKFLLLTPEEWVRQNFIRYLIAEKGFPPALMIIERGLKVNQNPFRADLLVCDRSGAPLLVVEFKAPPVKITQAAFDQIARYNMQFRVPYLIVSNGLSHFCCQIDFLSESYAFLKEIPGFKDIIAG